MIIAINADPSIDAAVRQFVAEYWRRAGIKDDGGRRQRELDRLLQIARSDKGEHNQSAGGQNNIASICTTDNRWDTQSGK